MKKIMAIFWVVMLAFALNVHAEEMVTSGKCGENATWNYENGVLTISGRGAMEDYHWLADKPWEEYIKEITKVVVGNGITSVGENTFYTHSSLTEVTIPDSIISIGDYAFYNCRSLTEMKLPDSMTSINTGLFFGCKSITKIVLPSSVTDIGNDAFRDCSSLMEIKLPDSVTSIGEDVFSNCASLTEVKIPDSVTSIGERAFYNCSTLTQINIPVNVTELDDRLFQGCESLTKIIIPGKVERINYYVFSDCTSLAEIAIPDSVISIRSGAFYNCSTLTEIKLPDSVANIGDSIFYNCSSLTKITIPDGITKISNLAFYGCTSLTEITLPDNITVIEDGAFGKCTSLTNISIPDSVTEIGYGAFNACTSLAEVNIPDKVTYIDQYTFEGCKSLAEIKIPDSVTEIHYKAFDRCGTLRVYIPPNVKEIHTTAFDWTTPIFYARPDSYAYGFAIKRGYELHDYYIPNVGDVVDEIIDSDIYVTMNGELIPSYCVDGCTLILVRDLERYGFDVSFDSEKKVAYATFNPDKTPYEGIATKLANRNVLHTDIRAIINGIEVEVRNTNGFIAVEAERLGNYVPQISCVWQSKYRRLQMQAFEDMASFEDLVNSISERKGIPQSYGCTNFADTDNGRFDKFVGRRYINKEDYNGYIYPQRGLRMADFALLAGRAYSVSYSEGYTSNITTYTPSYLSRYVKGFCEKGIVLPDENGSIYLDGILTKAQMEYYLDMLEQG